MRTHIIILLITFLLSSPISADVRFNPNRARGVPQNRISSSPFLSQSHITERRMQETNVTQQPVTIRLRGDTELGYYYATMFFGSPIQKQTLIVDTGSMTTTIPCQECGDNCGTHHFDKPFYHNLSATFELFNCEESFGAYTCGDCLNQCPFGVSYVEGSSYNGHFVRDYISFGNEIDDHYASLKVFEDNPTPKAIDLELDTSGNETVLPDFVSNSTDNDATLESLAQLAEIEDIVNQRRLFMPFGCTFRETKLFYEQEADGILGLGVNTNTQSTPPNILDTLTIYNSTFSKAFTLCLAQQGGYFTMGGYNHAYHADETVQYANFYTEYGQYRVNIEKIEVGGKSLELDHSALNKGEGAFFDSGTTLTYAPTETYNAITAAVKNYCTGKKHCGKSVAPDSKLCWKYEKSEFPSLEEYLSTFPTLKFYFGDDGKAEYEWRPEDYLYEKTSGRYCIGLSRYDRETILGATFMKNHDILFDKQNNRVGMIRSNCAAVNNESTPAYAPAEETHQNSEINAIQVTESPGAPEQGGKLSAAVVPSNNDYQKTILISVFVVLGISLVLGVSIYVCVKFKKNSSYADMGPEVEVPSRRDGNASSDASMEHTGNQDTQNQENQNQQVALPVMEMPMPIPIGIPKMVVSSE